MELNRNMDNNLYSIEGNQTIHQIQITIEIVTTVFNIFNFFLYV